MENITEKKYLRRFVCSDDHFSGFGIDIDITQIDSMLMIISKFRQELSEILKKYNFENLLKEFNKKKFHIHSITFEEILTSDINEILYICYYIDFRLYI